MVRCAFVAALLLGGVGAALVHAADASTADVPSRMAADATRSEQPSAPERVPTEQPVKTSAYSGLRLRQNPEGVVVSGVLPGPLAGDGFQSTSIWRGDLIVSLNGQALDVAGYRQLLSSLAAGDTLRVVYRRSSNSDPHAALPRGDPGGEERSIEIVLDDAARWRGTIGQGLAPGHVVEPAKPGEFEDFLLTNAEELGLRSAPGGVGPLLAHLSGLQQSLLAPNSLPAVVQALRRPLSLDQVEAEFASLARPLAEPQSLEQTLRICHQLLLRTLDVPDLQAGPDLDAKLSGVRRDYEQRAARLLKAMRDDPAPLGPDLPEYLELIRASPQIVPLVVAMLPAVAQRARELEQFAHEVSAHPQTVPPELAERVAAAVEGPVLGAKVVDGGLWIVGGDQANRYNMDLIAAVFDVGGPDVYTFSTPAQGPYQIIIDQSGDDVYESNGDFAGPAAGFFSVSLLWDRSGNDRYVSHRQGSIAAGAFGVGILIDESGDDEYINDTPGAGWSEGSGFYGAGVLIDRSGNDVYQAQILAQGVGGPGGIGLVVDGSGNDTYTANGPEFPSAYGTPGVFLGMSQGFGFGFRGYAPGGIGALYDLGGDDRYAVGEFGQGSGYFQGIGILHDAAGDDRYIGSRYVQGAAAHQAAGILIDEQGDDSYSCSGSAAQGAAWDQSIAMLVDRGGSDTYFADGLAQGAASHQAIGILIDLGGQDVYSCATTCLGQSGDNSYHYDSDRIFSFGALIHRGGKTDTYPEFRSNNERIRTGILLHENPGSSGCYGLFVDD